MAASAQQLGEEEEAVVVVVDGVQATSQGGAEPRSVFKRVGMGDAARQDAAFVGRALFALSSVNVLYMC